MSVRCTRPPTVRFTQIRNEWARDRRLGYKARGLLTYLHSHEDGYELSQAQIVRDGTDGKDAVRTGLEELEQAGYLRRVRPERGDGGRWGETDYELSDPFDSSGRLVGHLTPAPDQREIRPSDAVDQRETRRSGLSDPVTGADYPARLIRPIEDNGENTKRSSISPLPGMEGEEPPGLSAAAAFDAFWAAYPKKVGKDAARRAWVKAARRADTAKIIDVVRRYPFRPDRQYVKDPATWLNAGCWEDDLDAVAAANHTRNVGGGGYGPRDRPPYRDPDPRADPNAFRGAF